MENKYYGIYLGICISRMDPERRGRLKIFIPDINPALYDGWSKEGTNITIQCVGDNVMNGMSSALRAKLERILPYAEAASPIMGSSTSGFFDNATGSTVQTGDPGPQSPVSNPDPNAVSPASTPLASNNGNIKPSNAMNGQLDRSNPQHLVTLNSSFVKNGERHYLNPFTAKKFEVLCNAYKASTGKLMCISDSYRDMAAQVKVAAKKGLAKNGGLAAVPGTSNHGLGLAVDLGGSANDLAQKVWMFANARQFGFTTIESRAKKPTDLEAWHWETRKNTVPPEYLAYQQGGHTTNVASSGEMKPGTK